VYAVVETGGKQYKVQVGQTLDVELLDANIWDTVELNRVLMVADEGNVRVG
jgi:large subunit ribosomal protein L21